MEKTSIARFSNFKKAKFLYEIQNGWCVLLHKYWKYCRILIHPPILLGAPAATVVLQGGLATNLALLGAGKLGLAALYGTQGQPQEEEEGYESLFRKRLQVILRQIFT